jgi:hypothetical protein
VLIEDVHCHGLDLFLLQIGKGIEPVLRKEPLLLSSQEGNLLGWCGCFQDLIEEALILVSKKDLEWMGYFVGF